MAWYVLPPEPASQIAPNQWRVYWRCTARECNPLYVMCCIAVGMVCSASRNDVSLLPTSRGSTPNLPTRGGSTGTARRASAAFLRGPTAAAEEEAAGTRTRCGAAGRRCLGSKNHIGGGARTRHSDQNQHAQTKTKIQPRPPTSLRSYRKSPYGRAPIQHHTPPEFSPITGADAPCNARGVRLRVPRRRLAARRCGRLLVYVSAGGGGGEATH